MTSSYADAPTPLDLDRLIALADSTGRKVWRWNVIKGEYQQLTSSAPAQGYGGVPPTPGHSAPPGIGASSPRTPPSPPTHETAVILMASKGLRVVTKDLAGLSPQHLKQSALGDVMTSPKPPEGLSAAGRKLWRSVLTDFDLTEPETAVLREACRTADSIDGLQALLDRDGLMSESSQGPRVHPALVELRQQRIALARLFAALRIPFGEETEGVGSARTQTRSTRGVYGLHGVKDAS